GHRSYPAHAFLDVQAAGDRVTFVVIYALHRRIDRLSFSLDRDVDRVDGLLVRAQDRIKALQITDGAMIQGSDDVAGTKGIRRIDGRADLIRAADIDSFIIDLDADTVSAQDQFILCLNADRTKTEQDGTEDIQATLHKKTPPKRYFGKAR